MFHACAQTRSQDFRPRRRKSIGAVPWERDILTAKSQNVLYLVCALFLWRFVSLPLITMFKKIGIFLWDALRNASLFIVLSIFAFIGLCILVPSMNTRMVSGLDAFSTSAEAKSEYDSFGMLNIPMASQESKQGSADGRERVFSSIPEQGVDGNFDKLKIPVRGGFVYLRPSQIVSVEKEDRKNRIVKIDGTRILTREMAISGMKNVIEQRCDFFAGGQSAYINLYYVEGFISEPAASGNSSQYFVNLENGQSILLSKKAFDTTQEQFNALFYQEDLRTSL